jgi:stress-induced-phosphoprotein 1
MSDPEIQNILQDPVMRQVCFFLGCIGYNGWLCMQVLVDFQENPKAAQEHTKIPGVMDKIQKLISAGIVQMK